MLYDSYFYALMFLCASRQVHLKVVTTRVHAFFECSFTSPYAILRGNPSHFSTQGRIHHRKPHTHSARILTIFDLELETFLMLGRRTYQLSYALNKIDRFNFVLGTVYFVFILCKYTIYLAIKVYISSVMFEQCF